MIYKLSIVLVSLLFLARSSFAQTDLEKYKEKYPDKSGVFLTIEEHVTITVDKKGELNIETTHDQEILYLNDNYKFYMDGAIGFNSFMEYTDVNPAVYIPNGTKYKMVKIKDMTTEDADDSGVFHDDYKKINFMYEGLTKGGKTGLNYTKQEFEPHFFGSFYFNKYFPVERVVYTIETPADLDLGFKLYGNEKANVKYTTETAGGTTTHKWVAEGLKEYANESGMMDYRYSTTHLQMHIKSYKVKGETKNLLRNVDDLYAFYRDFVRDVNTEGNDVLVQIADSITKGIDSDDDKAKAIYYWVQDNIKYVAIEDGLGGFIPRNAGLVCSRKYGDCKDMSSVLYTMINGINLKAYYTWIGTRDVPYDYTDVPTTATDNHMICTYYNGKEYIFLDGTGKGTRFGMPTGFIQGKQALVGISEEEYKLIRVPVIKSEDNVTADVVYATIEDGVVKGKGVVTYSGYPSIYLSDYMTNLSPIEHDNFASNAFRKGNNKSTSKIIKETGVTERDEDLEIVYDFEIEDYVRINGNEIFINPFLKKYHASDKIKLETNRLDKEADFKEKNLSTVYIKIPDGYVLEYMPESTSFSHPEFGFDIQFTHDEANNQIGIITNFTYDYLIHKSEDFEAWNDMVKKLNLIYSELLIFQKP